MISEKSLKFNDLFGTNDVKLLNLPSKLFDPHRFLIMKILHAHAPVGFSELKQDLKLSDGNLASHLKVLENSGFVKSHKEFKDRKPRTSYELTESGIDAFITLKQILSNVLTNEH